MLNFGVSGLRLVAPRDGWPNEKAGATAAGASVVIDRAQVFETTSDALADCNYVLATTARGRETAQPVLAPQEAASELREQMAKGARCAVLFGGERSGLTSDDVARADAILSIPVNPAFASLNLAQAVMVIAYEWSRKSGYSTVETPLSDEPAANRRDLDGLWTHLETELDEAGYFFPPEKRTGMARNLRAAITRAGFTQQEVHSLRGVIKALANKRRSAK